MALHDELAELRAAVGEQAVDDPVTFRAAFDDFLPEGSASTGEVSLLVGAIATGALQRLREQLALGADPATSIAAQGDLLARDRGTSETQGARWALSVLAQAVGAVPDELVLTRPTVPDSVDLPDRPGAGAAAVDPGPTRPVADPTRVVSEDPPPPPPAPPAESPPRGRGPLLAAAVVLALVAVSVVALLLLRDDDPAPTARDEAGTSDDPSTSTTPADDEEVLAQLDVEDAGTTVRLQLVRDGTDADVVLLADRDGEYVEVDRLPASCPFLDTSYDAGLEDQGDRQFFLGWQNRGNEGHGEYGEVQVDEEMVILYGIDVACPSEH